MITAILHRGLDAPTPVFLELPVSRWDVLVAEAQLGVDSLNECFFKYEPPTDLPQAGCITKSARSLKRGGCTSNLYTV